MNDLIKMTMPQQLDWLIRELSPAIEIPADANNKWRLFRALINLRQPEPISNEFISVQDNLLQSIIIKNGITNIIDLNPIRNNIYLWRGDITTLKVDAIVNAANSGMLGCFVPNHACIDNAIHTFAGVQLRNDCAVVMKKQGFPEPTGQAKITEAYNLPSRYILHTVGPIIPGKLTQGDCDFLASCYRSCLLLAEQNNIDSIAFCCISTGEFRFPNEKAAEIAIQTVERYLTEKSNKVKVIFNVFKEIDYRFYKKLLETNR